MKKRSMGVKIAAALAVMTVFAGCGANKEETRIQVFIAASLTNAMEEAAAVYNETHPEVTIWYNADSSGTLMQQITEGASCDIFFSAAAAQMDRLEEEGLVIDGTRVDLLNNKVVLITAKGGDTQVTGFADMDRAESLALADGSVPVGKYTRQILVNMGILEGGEDVSSITSNQVSEALGGIEINECGNVSRVKEAVKEGANEIGTVYYSDAYSVKEDVDILEEADTDLTGEIVYPVARIRNDEAVPEQTAAAEDFLAFLQTDDACAIFEKYMFVINQ